MLVVSSNMKKSIVLFCIVGINIIILFSWVYQNNSLVKLSFEKQKYEKIKASLFKEKERLQQQLCHAQSKATIKKFAKNELKMGKMKPHNIKTVSQPL